MKMIIICCIAATLLMSFCTIKKQDASPVKLSHNMEDTTPIQYVCLPCGSDCDQMVSNSAGICSHCNMPLVDKASIHFNSIEPMAMCSFIEDMGKGNVVLLDVRTREEFNGTALDKFGRLAGAINIPVQELTERLKELYQYKNKNIIVYCSHSHRSPRASYLLTQRGFKKVTNMQYGMSEWNNKVKPDDCNNQLYVKQ